MTRVLPLALLVAALLVPGQALGHGGGEPFIHVPLDHVMPGQTFPLIGADVAPNSVVSFKIVRGDVAVPLGRVMAGADGHFTTTRLLPPNVPDGYAQLVAVDSDGSRAAAWILIGERMEAMGPPPRNTSSQKGSAAVIALIVAGSVLVLAAAAAFALQRRPRRGSHCS